MKKFPKFFLIIALVSLLIPFNLVTASVSPAGKYGDVEKFIGTIEQIDRESRKNNTEKKLEFGKKNDTFSESYQDKSIIKEEAAIIKELIKKAPEIYSDMYLDSDTGTIIVQIKDDSDLARNEVMKQISREDKVKFEVVKYSKKDFDDAKKIIKDMYPGGFVQAFIPDTKNNKLILSLSEYSEENKSKIRSNVLNKDLIEFIPPIKVEDQVDTTYYPSIPSGAMIVKWSLNSDNTWTGSGCTSGYSGVNASNQDVLVTTGHCDVVGSNSVWKQYAPSTTSFGTWSFRTTSAADGSNASSDAGYIRYTDSNRDPLPYIPYPSNDMTPISGVYLSDLVNDTVYIRGATTGGLVSGQIKYANVDVYFGKNGYGYVRDLVLASYTSQNGDSGGPIVTDYAWDTTMGSYTFDLAGTHKGRITISDHSQLVDGVYAVYNPIWTSYSDLNLSGVYLAN